MERQLSEPKKPQTNWIALVSAKSNLAAIHPRDVDAEDGC
jgi:hypothetical protein